MLEAIVWFLVILVIIPLLYIVENFIRSGMSGYNKAYFLQSLYRLIRLFGKEDLKQGCPYRWFSIASFWFAGCALYFSVTGGHLIFIYACLFMMELFILAAAWNQGEAFAAMAAQRGIVRLLVCSFTVLVSAASLRHVTGTLILKEIFEFSQAHPMLLQLPLTFLAMITVLLIRGSLLFFDFNITGKSPGLLDSPLYTPYGGWSLALAQITHWVEIGVWIKLVSMFLPFSPWISFAVSVLCYLAFLMLDGFISKAQWRKVARDALIWGGGMSVINFIWLVLL